tara:strand:- start:356 stop:820 length:465 start_codon:yes stop_codon:yes gene_type:complete
MTNTRATNEELEQRINYAADQLAKGERSMVIVKKLAKKYGVSPQQSRDYVREARKVLTSSIAPNDRAFIFSKVMSCLEQDRLDARDQENIKEQGKATGNMVKMVGMITSIDQVGCWDDAQDSYLYRNFSEAKKKIKHSDLDALDGTDTDEEMPF